jgi:hypothetical protein
MKRERKESLIKAIRRASGSTQFAFVLDARLAEEAVDLSVEGDAAGWRLGWRWNLGERDLGGVIKQLFPSIGDLPPIGVENIKLGSVYTECFSGKAYKGVSLGIADFNFLYVSVSTPKKEKPGTFWALAREKPIEIPASGVAATLIGEGLKLSDLRVGSVSGFTEELRREVVGNMPQARLLLGSEGAPPTGLVAGITIGIGANPISIPFGGRTAVKAAKTSVAPKSDAKALEEGPSADSVESSDGMRKWFVVGKNIGPLRIGRVGCEWKDSKIGILLDAAVDVGGLHFGLTGLGVRMPPFDMKLDNLELGLDGIDLAYRGGPISISGSFLRSEVTVKGQKTFQYDGMAMIRAANFGITGFGSYASVEGRASLYIFAILHMELGGPPCFRVNGLAAGFGYNRKLILPPIEEVYNFPLVRAALEPGYLGSAGEGNSIQEAMGKLRKFIPPSPGDYWLAIGIRFNSFEMIQAFALLSVSFGNDVEIGLLGSAAVAIPKGVERGRAIAYAELALKVAIKPSEGTIKMEARLTSESYVFYKDCHLTGGFAFYIWFGGSLAGDFVLTLGGYHPKFLRPSHYPTVPRLGINWQVTEEMTITAGMYFALTPSCLMLGGKLSAVYQSSSVKVWFIVYADFLLNWKPFYYLVDIKVSLGIEVDLGAISIRIHLGAELQLWGPEFAGLVRIDLTVITITVHFGPEKKAPPPLTAKEFVESFLPPPPVKAAKDKDSSVIVTQINSGLIREEKSDGRVLRVVNAHGLSLTTQSLIPVSDFTGLEPQGTLSSSPSKLGIRSMGKTKLTSRYDVAITGEADVRRKKNMRTFIVKAGVPDALWGASTEEGKAPLPDKPKANTISAWSGLRIEFDPIAPKGALPPMAITTFAYETFNKPIPWNDKLKVEETIAAEKRKEIWTVMDDASRQARNAVLAVLAKGSPFDLNTTDLTELAKATDPGEPGKLRQSYFQADPEICQLGEAFV